MRPTLLFMAALFPGQVAAVVQTPEQEYFEWTKLPFPAAEYVNRRARLLAELRSSGGGLFLTTSGSGTSSGETFRPQEDFLYFTGLELPEAVFALDAESGEAVVFAPSNDPRFASPSRTNDFPGRPLADDSALSVRTGLPVHPSGEFAGFVSSVRSRGRHIRVNARRPGSVERVVPEVIHTRSADEGFLAWLQGDRTTRIENAYESVAKVRMVKSDAEIATMRRAATITVNAIRETAATIRPGVDERTLEGILEQSFKSQGAQRRAFASIIKSGPNSLWPWRILASHYNRRNRVMQAGDLVIFDVGAEYNYYVSDVGRTFPVSGTFSPRQREILAMEVAVSDAIIQSVRPGVTFADLQRIADSAIPTQHKAYMQTGLFFGHHLGLNTGDPNLPDAPLQAGMVFTVEPWYYNHDEDIAVFTEDEILVTTTGAEVLTRNLPRSPDELERMVTASR